VSEPTRRVSTDYSALMDDDGSLSPVAQDLLSLAQAAYLKDREVRRGSSPDDPRWHRPLSLTVPVRQWDVWSSTDVSQAVVSLLDWMTDDTWAVSWARHAQSRDSGQSRLSLPGPEREVMLFSGGLDAVAGAAILLASRNLLAVGIATNRVMQGFQSRTLTSLHKARLGSLESRLIEFSVVGGKRDIEPTRRTRGLVFLAVGAAVALQHGRQRCVMAENGVGAINLPLTSAQSGAMTSRSAHPRTLRKFSELIQLLTQQPFDFAAPFMSMTKGEMVAKLPEVARDACNASESCDRAASGRGALERRCGYCTSCLLRRMSFSAADRANWDTRPYLADTRPDVELSRQPEMLWQAATLDRALRRGGRDELVRAFPDLVQVPTEDLTYDEQRRLLSAYVDEWRRYPAPVIRQYLTQTPLGG
jgi:7-cyano-7-deazaguanine synthase in queuosine biosynthesis